MSGRFNFHEDGESASKNADRAADAYLGAFAGNGDLSEVESGLRQMGFSSTGTSSTRSVGMSSAVASSSFVEQKCEECEKVILNRIRNHRGCFVVFPSEISGPASAAMKVGEKYYHATKDCWRCRQCRLKLGESYVDRGGGVPVCSKCSQDSQSITSKFVGTPRVTKSVGEGGAQGKRSSREIKRCGTCFKEITAAQKFVTLKGTGMAVHSSCFKCSLCATPLAGKPFGQSGEGLPLCSKCNMQGNKKCVGCFKVIQGAYVTAGEAKQHAFHKECFKCFKCSTPLAGLPYGVDSVGNPLCAKCIQG